MSFSDDEVRALEEAGPEGALLRQVWPFRPIGVHARSLGVPVERLEALRGSLVTFGEARGAIAAYASAEPEPIGVLAIITRDRTALLERCLASHVSSVRRVVIDGSIEASTREAHRALAQRHGAAYVGLEEKRARVDRIDGDRRRLLAFALGVGGTRANDAGANRNAALLFAAGAPLVMVDDDTTARTTTPASRDLVITSAHDSTELTFFRDVEGALREAPFDPAVDPIALHQRLLGRSVAACVRDAPKIDLDGARPKLLSMLMREGGRVALTALGVAGDSGMGAPEYVLGVDEPSRSRLWATYAPRSRAVWRWVPEETITSSALLMSASLGIDARVRAPFFPHGRNQDGLFAQTVRAQDPGALIGHLPAGVEHSAPGRVSSAGGTRVTDAIIGLMLDGGLAATDLRGRLARAEVARVQRQIARFAEALERAPDDAPIQWRRDVEARIATLAVVGSGVPDAETIGVDAALARFAESLRDFFDLIEVWPSFFYPSP